MRTFLSTRSQRQSSLVLSSAWRQCALQMPKDQRDLMTKHLTAAREEAKGQALDLADMGDAARNVSKNLQEQLKRVSVTDEKFKGKAATITASLKAYNTRLSNLQNEARGIQSEIDSVLKLMWGTDAPLSSEGASGTASQKEPQKAAVADDFSCDVPPMAQRLEHMNRVPSTPSTPASGSPKKVEVVEGEVVRGAASKTTSTSPSSEEIEIESIEIEVEPEPSSTAASPAQEPQSPADTMSITDITKDLYERGINFSDCLDAQSLRRRYREVLDGKFGAAKKPAAAQNQQSSSTPSQPPPPPRSQYHQQQQQWQQPPPNTSETGIAHDPYPNAHRKMVDPMKFVWEVKQELSREKGLDPNSIDLWSGKIKLDDHKRLYDYPSIQSTPMEVRQKGDIPH